MQFLPKLLAIPIDQSALGNVEPLGDAAQAPALGPEFEELVFGVGVIHSGARFRQLVMVRSGARRASLSRALGRAAAARSGNCTDAQGSTVELHGRANYFRDFC